MAAVIYNAALDTMHQWESADFRFLLLQGDGYTPDSSHEFVSDLVPASNEVAGSGYSRQPATNRTRTVDDTLDQIRYDCDDLSFGAIEVGEVVRAVVLYRHVTNDADSPLIGYWTLGGGIGVQTSGSNLPVLIPPSGVIVTSQGPS